MSSKERQGKEARRGPLREKAKARTINLHAENTGKLEDLIRE
jgi:hypothetical protein